MGVVKGAWWGPQGPRGRPVPWPGSCRSRSDLPAEGLDGCGRRQECGGGWAEHRAPCLAVRGWWWARTGCPAVTSAPFPLAPGLVLAPLALGFSPQSLLPEVVTHKTQGTARIPIFQAWTGDTDSWGTMIPRPCAGPLSLSASFLREGSSQITMSNMVDPRALDFSLPVKRGRQAAHGPPACPLLDIPKGNQPGLEAPLVYHHHSQYTWTQIPLLVTPPPR